MHKRRRSQDDEHDARARKRTAGRLHAPGDLISGLSDEVLLKILSFLPVESVTTCARVSKRFHALSDDSQIWRPAFQDKWIRTATSRDETDWKQKYKTFSNWSKGRCRVAEIAMAAPPASSLLARLHAGIIITVDEQHGLRAWRCREKEQLIAQLRIHKPGKSGRRCVPTVLEAYTPDVQSAQRTTTTLAVGAQDGSLSLYRLTIVAGSPEDAQFTHVWSGPKSEHGAVLSIAVSGQHMLTLSDSQLLNLYRFDHKSHREPETLKTLKAQSRSDSRASSLSLSSLGSSLVMRVAYPIQSFSSGWTVGLQEFTVAHDGTILSSRSATSEGTGHCSRPTAMTYKHPYLVSSHPDNTLTLYTVASGAGLVSVSVGQRLWGHTSAVLGAQIGDSGRAISVSKRGDEVRVWTLAGTSTGQCPHEPFGTSVRLQPQERQSTGPLLPGLSQAVAELRSGLGLADGPLHTEDSITKTWAGFDDDHAVVMRQHGTIQQALAVYDFT